MKKLLQLLLLLLRRRANKRRTKLNRAPNIGLQMEKTRSNLTSSGRLATMMMMEDEEDMTRSAISAFQSREEEIEKKKMEVREKVESQLSRAEEETRRLAQIWEVSSRNTSFTITTFKTNMLMLNHPNTHFTNQLILLEKASSQQPKKI